MNDSNLNREQIVDKNGKLTHVWKLNDQGHHTVERIKGIATVPPRPVYNNPLHSAVEALREVTDKLIYASNECVMMSSGEPPANSPEHSEWKGQYDRAYTDLHSYAFEAQGVIEDIELELNAHEAEGELYDDDEYRESVQALLWYKEDIYRALNKAGVFERPGILSERVLRTALTGEQAAGEVYGEARETQVLPNGSSNYVFSNGDGTDTIVQVNRLGNVTRFSNGKEDGDFEAASVDFPISRPTGTELRGEYGRGITAEDVDRIIYIATGRKGDFFSTKN